MNQRIAIEDAGRKAYQARRNRDEATCRHWTQWAKSAANLDENPTEAYKIFTEAYKDEASYYSTPFR